MIYKHKLKLENQKIQMIWVVYYCTHLHVRPWITDWMVSEIYGLKLHKAKFLSVNYPVDLCIQVNCVVFQSSMLSAQI